MMWLWSGMCLALHLQRRSDLVPRKKALGHIRPMDEYACIDIGRIPGGAISPPPPVVHLSDILECNFDLSSDATLPYDVFDALRSHHGIDVTGLSVSSAHRGNLCRSYALLGAGCDDMAAFKAQSAEATLGVTNAWDTAMRLCLLHELLKNSLAPDLRRCRRACGIPATKPRKRDIVQYM